MGGRGGNGRTSAQVDPTPATPMTAQDKVRAAYAAIMQWRQENNFERHPLYAANDVPMGQLREESGLSRAEFDLAVKRLSLHPDVFVYPETAQWLLTNAARHNAVHFGGQDKHWYRED